MEIPLTEAISETVRPNGHRSMDFYYRALAAKAPRAGDHLQTSYAKNNV